MQRLVGILKRLLVWATQALIGTAMIVFALLMLIEWASGCGEAYTDAKGKVHTNECVHHAIYKHLLESK